LLKIFY